MEIVTEPDIYSPSIDENGNYVDKIPSFHIIQKGLLCPCGTRKDKLYDNHSRFAAHIKSKNHQKWLNQINLNRVNYFVENKNLEKTIHHQRLIIARLEKDLQHKSVTIDYLSQQLIGNKTNPVVHDLLSFDE
jgi:hypothetical protein